MFNIGVTSSIDVAQKPRETRFIHCDLHFGPEDLLGNIRLHHPPVDFRASELCRCRHVCAKKYCHNKDQLNMHEKLLATLCTRRGVLHIVLLSVMFNQRGERHYLFFATAVEAAEQVEHVYLQRLGALLCRMRSCTAPRPAQRST